MKAQGGWDRFGRYKIKISENFDEVVKRWKTGEITAVKAMELTGLKKTTFYNMIKKSSNT